tara:strand:+ start:134 stop:340 length:207 start_codon:yes stop_codon:yes gene_type:complete
MKAYICESPMGEVSVTIFAQLPSEARFKLAQVIDDIREYQDFDLAVSATQFDIRELAEDEQQEELVFG